MRSFEEQFAERHVTATRHGDVQYAVAAPPELKDETPVLVAHGWSADIPAHELMARHIYNDGRQVIVPEHPRYGRVADRAGVPGEIVQRSYNLIGVLDALGIDKADAIAHSGGAPDVIELARRRPGILRAAVLCAPSSLVDDQFSALSRRTLSEWRRRMGVRFRSGMITLHPVDGTERSLVRSLRANPAKLMREAVAVAGYTILDHIDAVQRAGTPVGVLHPLLDCQFPAHRSRHVTGRFADYQFVDDAGHEDILTYPERSGVRALAMLGQLAGATTIVGPAPLA